MGLDMYLYANRHYSNGDPALDQLLAVHGYTLEQLMSTAGVTEWSRQLEAMTFLPTWHWMTGDDAGAAKVSHAIDVLRAADMERFIISGTGSSSIGWLPERQVVEVSVPCAYWRKANAVHNWFVTNVQDDVDECQRSPDVDAEQLAMLIKLCEQGIEAYEQGNIEDARSLMTPVDGFFFGEASISESWLYDMTNTVSQVSRAIHVGALAPFPVNFHYQSSW